MRLHIPGGGSFGFRLLRSFALELQDALREACGLTVERTHKPHERRTRFALCLVA
jgi:hypothetical protein